jgi:hypothetical protein
MTSILRVWNKSRSNPEHLEAPTTTRGWVLNGYGTADFTLSTADPKCTETNLQYGNLVHAEHIPSQDGQGNTNGKLPDWVGIILPTRSWDDGMVHVKAYSAEAILTFRPMPFVSVSGTPANVFRTILNHANALKGNTIRIQPGIVDDLPLTFANDLRLSAYDEIQKLTADTGMDWDVTAEIDARGTLQLYANLYARKGQDASLTLNSLNTELSAPLLTEQGTPYNYVYGYSQAPVPQQRYMVEAIHQDALDDYGLFAINQTFTGKHDVTSVQNAAQAQADARGRPVKLTKRIVLDKGDAFSHLDTGNVLRIKDTRVGFKPGGGFGFEAQARILSLDYNDLSNKCPLNIEVIQ